jgi:uncharacterized MnhB-related membrane protein
MTGVQPFDVALAPLLVATALPAVVVRERFAGTVVFVVVGMLVAIAWVRLCAVNVALAEAAIGAGLTGMPLLGTQARLRQVPRGTAPGPGMHLAAAALSLAVAGGIGLSVIALPALGLGNPVTGVLLGFRAWDTLLESVVLLIALLGVWSLAPDPLWGGRPGLRHRARPHGVLAWLGSAAADNRPSGGRASFLGRGRCAGGAFQAGTVLGAVWILAVMAGLSHAPAVGGLGLRLALVAGPALFLAVPPMAGFVSKWWLGTGALAAGQPWVLAVLAASSLLNAAYFLPVLYRAWFLPPPAGALVVRTFQREGNWGLLLPPLATAAALLGAGLLAAFAWSPLGWVRLVIERDYGL